MKRSELLLDDYNHYRFHTHAIRNKRAAGQYITSVGATPRTRPKYLGLFDRMAVWCSERDIDPRSWLHSLFEARFWLHAPRIEHLCSKKHLKRYAEKKGSSTLYRERIAAEQHELDDGVGRVFHSERDVSYAAETLKIRYQQRGRPGRCMELMSTETFGFHPKSSVCASCPIASSCEAMLHAKVGYDIQAVRRGEMSYAQARVMVAYGDRR